MYYFDFTHYEKKLTFKKIKLYGITLKVLKINKLHKIYEIKIIFHKKKTQVYSETVVRKKSKY